MIDPVLAADPIEQHLGVLQAEPAGEDLAVVGEDLLGNPVGAHRGREVGAHGTARGPGHDPGTHDEPRMVIDPGEHLALRSIGE